MNYITTNIRIPEEDYMELKMLAAKQRKSMAEIIRSRIIKKKTNKKRDVNKLVVEMDKLAEKIARQNPGLNLTKALIEMRYEQ